MDFTTLLKWNKAYRSGEPIVSDKVYDEAVELLKNTPEYQKNKFLLTEDTGDFKHPFIIGSLEKFKFAEDEAAMQKWLGAGDIIITPKIDGASLVAYYNEDGLVNVATRGDGTQGISRYSKLVSIFPNIKNQKIVVRGEAVITYENFERLCQETGTIYKNPRNAVSGLISDKKSKIDLSKYITFIAYQILGNSFETYWDMLDTLQTLGFKNVFESYWDMLNTLKTLGFNVPVSYKVSANKVNDNFLMDLYKTLSGDGSSFDIDGLVLQKNNIWDFNRVYYPTHSKAWKPNLQAAETEIVDINWSLTKDGKLCPVAQIKPVELGGSTVSNVSVFNYEFVKTHGLGIGAKVAVLRSGDVIPVISSVISQSTNFNFPKTCPECGSSLEIEGKHLVCRGKNCKLQNLKRLHHFLRNLNIEVANTTSLENWGLYTIIDLLNFMPKGKNQEKFYNELLTKLFTASKTDILKAADWRGIGTKTVEKLLQNNNIDNFISVILKKEKPSNSLKLSTGVTIKTIESMISNNDFAKEALIILKDHRWHSEAAQVKQSIQTLSGISFCFTGSLSIPRSKAEKLATDLGAKISGVSKKLTYLVTNDTESGSSKNRKALELGIKIINEQEFFKLVNYRDTVPEQNSNQFDITQL